jgi:hypothetical protein
MRGLATATVFLGLILCDLASVGASDITAASCYPRDVQAALSRAKAGDTVNIPAGTCHWTTGVDWFPVPANVTIRGAGTASMGSADQTIIVDDYASDKALIALTPSATGVLRMTGITFRGGNSGDNTKYAGFVAFSGGTSHVNVRMDHMTFRVGTYSTVYGRAGGCASVAGVYGVIDHNIFDQGDSCLRIYNASPANQAWAEPTGLGTNTFTFIENNSFAGKLSNDCQGGGKFVFRFNTFTNTGIQVHPTGGAQQRGCRAWEIYGNTFNGVADPPYFTAFFVSSGTGVIWGNSVTTEGYKNFVVMYSMRRNNSTYTAIAPPNGWGYCGTSFNGTGSNWDGNQDTTTGYPCLDQPGQGQGDLIVGDFPNVINAATGCTSSQPCAWPRQALEPVREWLNLPFTPAPGYGGSFWSVREPEVLRANRDYYLYTGSFTGASGVGSGPRSSRPATCTAGVAYWSIDQGGNWNTINATANDGTLDVCTATNTWTNSVYTPYIYPHPLTQTQIAPATPTNLHIR